MRICSSVIHVDVASALSEIILMVCVIGQLVVGDITSEMLMTKRVMRKY